MAAQKPVVYPNILDQITATVDAHAAIRKAVETHADAHHAVLEERRKQLKVAQMAKKLIEGDGKS